MIGKTDHNFMQPEEALKAEDDDIKVLEQEVCINGQKEKITRNDGKEEWKLVTKCPWYDDSGKLMGVVGISNDITEDVLNQNNLRIIKNHLALMISTASHDLRKPMSSMLAILRLIIRGSYGYLDESVKVELNEVVKNINKQSMVISDYLSKSSLLLDENEVPKKERFDLRRDIINPIIEELAPFIEQENIRIDMSLGGIPIDQIVVVEANKGWLSIVYRNLIANSIKYGGKGCIIAFGFKDMGEFNKLNVYNSGPPVKEELKSKLFDLFEGEGTGLGLHSARELIRKHGGDMWYEESLDHHPNFVFTLPKVKT
jgi:signal transduction histidine kinase